MANLTKIAIGIQARSTSNRLPGKPFMLIGGIPMLKHVVTACEKAAQYTNGRGHQNNNHVSISVLVPAGDQILSVFGNSRMDIFEGSENDVLSRYHSYAVTKGADYIVRITGDCPLIPPFLITKAIKAAVINRFDYFSNVDPDLRTSPDGHDVEVISMRALSWANENAKDSYHREHVTSILRTEELPRDFSRGHIVNFVDISHMKLSVDTPEDLERVREHFDRIFGKIKRIEQRYGKNTVHKF